MTIHGNLAVFGIDTTEEGLFLSDLTFTGEADEIEQEDEQSNIVGVGFYKPRVQFSCTGEVKRSATGAATNAGAVGIGSVIAMNNECPDNQWLGGTPPATTLPVLKSAPFSRSRGSLATQELSGTIYGMAAS